MQVQQFVEWKRAYTNALIDRLKPKGDVLEIGFGNGYAAERIQHYHPKSHTIVEKDPKLAAKAKAWAKGYANVTVIEGPWESALPANARFDTLFFNDYPLTDDVEMIKRKPPKEAVTLVNEAKQTLHGLQDQLSKLAIKYSDQDIDDFCNSMGKDKLEQFPTFFMNLKKSGFITEKQYQRVRNKYKFAEKERPLAAGPLADDPFLDFVKRALDKHTSKGSRISCYAIDSSSKFDNPHFFDHVITNPNLHFDEETITISHPTCDIKDALVIQIERIA